MEVSIQKIKNGVIVRKKGKFDVWILFTKDTVKVEVPYDAEMDDLDDLLWGIKESLEAFLTAKKEKLT